MICVLLLLIGTCGSSSVASVKRLRRPALTRALKLLVAWFSGGVTMLVPPISMLSAGMGRLRVVVRISVRLVRLSVMSSAGRGTSCRVLVSPVGEWFVRIIRLLVFVSVPVALKFRLEAVLAMRKAWLARLGTLATP